MYLPDLSVIVPVYNDPDGLERTLESLTEQTLAKGDYEIIVVDNRSTDETVNVIDAYSRGFPDLVTGLRETEVQSSYAARNRGIEAARGEYLAFIDADMHVDSMWAESVVRKMTSHRWRYMGCDVEVYLPQDTVAAKSSAVMDFPVGEFIEEKRFAPTCSLVVEAGVFDQFGSFDERLTSGGDFEFGRRVYEAGVTQHYAPDISVYHPARTTLRACVSREWRIGRGISQLKSLHPDRCGEFHPALWKLMVPPRPRYVLDVVRGSVGNRVDLPWIYLMKYVRNLGRAGGRIHEMVDPSTNKAVVQEMSTPS